WNRAALVSEAVFVPQIWSFVNDWPGSKSRSLPSGFGAEMLESVRRLYASANIHPNFRHLKGAALASAALKGSVDCYRAQRYLEMQRYFFYALARSPRRVLKKAGGQLSLRMALGPLLPLASLCRSTLRRWGI